MFPDFLDSMKPHKLTETRHVYTRKMFAKVINSCYSQSVSLPKLINYSDLVNDHAPCYIPSVIIRRLPRYQLTISANNFNDYASNLR